MTDVISLINSRKIAFNECSGLYGNLQTHSTLVTRLGFASQLEGHKGCVNCLQWNNDGSLLASGSDDLEIKIWNIYEKRLVASMNSGHTGNIFSAKFMPFSSDLSIVSCAEDRQVHLHDLSTFTTTRVWSCPSGRVKRLAINKQSPYLVWSASEDGFIRQYDIRENHTCREGGRCRNVLIDLKKTCGPNSSCKCIDINPVHTEQIAIGANDAYIRLYDIRVLSLSYPSTELCDRPDPGCIAHYAPGHVSQSFRRPSNNTAANSIACTYVSFSPCGNELLANLSSEQIYLFNTISQQPVLTYTHHDHDPLIYHKPSNCPITINSSTVRNESSVADRIRLLRDKGNEVFKNCLYVEAIEYYSTAILYDPLWYVLYSNRATALVKRNWCGDVYDALKDTERALCLNPFHQKSLQRRIKCLKYLGWLKEALWYLLKYQELYPNDKEYFTKHYTQELIQSDAMGNKNGYHSIKVPPSEWEQSRQQNAFDYYQRFIGHCNTHTDIKEATFLGQNGEYIGAGSDDGNIFIWEKKTGNVVKVLTGDESIVNCVQWNPNSCILATSGIEPVIKIWEPRPLDDTSRSVGDVYKVCKLNQKRMKVDPFEIMLMRMGLRMANANPTANEHVFIEQHQCRQS